MIWPSETHHSGVYKSTTYLFDGKADGRRSALWFRCHIQKELFQLGCFLQRHAGKVLFVALLILASLCVGLKSAILHSRVEQLWIEEGGRLETELKYVEEAIGESVSNTHQLVIQTPKDAAASLLHPDALLAHLKVIKSASSVTVYLFNVPWKLKDICYSPGFSSFDMHYIDQIFRDIIPCAIITPLDCFWEGSKLLGPDNAVTVPNLPKLKWTSLNPQTLLYTIRNSYNTNFPIKTLEEIMKRAGITTGYQEKPCLNPKDKECPATAPNKNSTKRLDIGAELTGGCYGFASKYMHWPEDLIIGGAKRNKSGHVQKANGLQTVIQLMDDRDLYDYYKDDYKVHQIDWTPQKAALVLEAWQRKFSDEVKRQMKMGEESSAYDIFSFSTATLNDILSHYSKVDFRKIIVGYLIMLLFVALSLLKWKDPIMSQTAVGIAGTILVVITVAAALGFCAVFGIAFNASTTQIIPFLGLGLGIVDMFLLTSAYAGQLPGDAHPEEQTGLVLKKGGLSVLLTSLSNLSAFLAAAIIPIPALRVFSLQAAILVFFNLVSTLLVLPAIISIDLRRRRTGRVDIFCCCCVMPGDGTWPCIDGDKDEEVYAIAESGKFGMAMRAREGLQAKSLLMEEGQAGQGNGQGGLACGQNQSNCQVKGWDQGKDWSQSKGWGHGRWSVDALVEAYAKLLCGKSMKAATILAFMAVLAASAWNVGKVMDGLDLSDVVPTRTAEHDFLHAQEKYFGFYTFHAITQGDFEYPTNQKLLYEYHDAFTRVPNIVKNDNGGLPQFWLGLFRDWLLGLQKAFDKDWLQGSITQERWYANASDEGILAYKLLVQTGYVENPVDKSLVPQARLVDAEGIVNPDAFYNYLSAWICNDALAYSASQANLKPEPKSWCHVANDYELKIPKSSPLTYAQIPFYVQGLGDTHRITKLITQVRDLCQRFEQRGLPNFPSGIPFLFWEQYRGLRQYLGAAMACALGAIFCIVFLLLFNLWAALTVTLGGAAMVLQLLGAFGAIGIKLSAVPAVLLVIAVGINMHFIVHICYSFLTAIGNRDRRLELAMKHMLSLVTQAAITTILAVIMLAFNDFDFIVKYFFYTLVTLVGIGLLNGLLFFPVLLSLIGPPAEVKPSKYPDRISTPSPEPVKKLRKASCRQSTAPPKRHRKPSLSTITEEPGSCHSNTHEIVVEPELVVETTTFTTHPPPPPPGSSSGNSSGNESSYSSSPVSVHRVTTSSGGSTSCGLPPSTMVNNAGSHITTKVTATAKFKVEVHAPMQSYDRRYSTRRRDSTSSISTTSTECSSKH